LEKAFDAAHVFRHVHATASSPLPPRDLPAVSIQAQLFQLLDSLQLALRQRWIFQQGVALKNAYSPDASDGDNNLLAYPVPTESRA